METTLRLKFNENREVKGDCLEEDCSSLSLIASLQPGTFIVDDRDQAREEKRIQRN